MESHPSHQVGVLDALVVVLVGDDIGTLVGIHAQVEQLGNAVAGEGSYQTPKPPGFFISQNTAFQFSWRNATSTPSSL